MEKKKKRRKILPEEDSSIQSIKEDLEETLSIVQL